jgi:hypothetical protein
VFISARILPILTAVVHGFSQLLQAYSRIVSQARKECFLPNPFQLLSLSHIVRRFVLCVTTNIIKKNREKDEPFESLSTTRDASRMKFYSYLFLFYFAMNQSKSYQPRRWRIPNRQTMTLD